MRKTRFLSLLCLVAGVQFAASADVAIPGKITPKAQKANATFAKPKPAPNLPLKAKAAIQSPKKSPFNKATNHFKHRSSSSSESTDSKEINKILHILETECVHYIKCVPYEISAPGYYKLACDLVFKPKANGTNAITIADGVTDVNIDFANHTLSMSTSSTYADNNGILLNSNCENIVIHDGSITGFSASAIRGYAGLNTIEVCDMILEGISSGNRMVTETIASGVNLGAIVEDPQQFSPQQSEISSNIKLTDLTIRGITLNNNTIADQYAWGVCLFYCNNIELDRVLVNEISHTGLIDNNGAGAVRGFSMVFCTNSVSRFCTGCDLTCLSPNFAGAVVGDATGALYQTCERVANYDCTYSNNTGTRRGGGLTWFAGTSDFVAERCVANSNRVADETQPGIQSHYGFESVGIVARNKRGVINDCHVLNQPIAFAVLDSDDVILENCTATAGNIVPGSVIFPAGFRAYSGANGVTFKNCIATGFALTDPATTPAGFRMTSGATNVNILGCKSTKNSIGIFVASGVTNVVADSNEVAFNTFVGLKDTTATQTHNLYTRNVAFANTTNYSVNTTNANFAVVQASQAAGYPLYTAANASPLSNFDLQP